MARVKVTDHNADGEEEEETVPTSKLIRPSLNHVADEKPQFPNTVADPRLCVPFELSDGDQVPYTINRYLRDYQREGIRFMYNSYRRCRGCILGDDMGLGKTVQVMKQRFCKTAAVFAYFTCTDEFLFLRCFTGYSFPRCVAAENGDMGGHSE